MGIADATLVFVERMNKNVFPYCVCNEPIARTQTVFKGHMDEES